MIRDIISRDTAKCFRLMKGEKRYQERVYNEPYVDDRLGHESCPQCRGRMVIIAKKDINLGFRRVQ